LRARVDLPDEAPLQVGAKLALGAEVAVSLARARWNLRRRGLPATLATLRACEGAGRGYSSDPVASGRRLGRVVRRTLSVLPGDTRCLSQSLVLTRLLAARGMESQLVIGVRSGEEFAAHAWVEHQGAALLPPGVDHFDELVTL
jgi:hypothetical protein